MTNSFKRYGSNSETSVHACVPDETMPSDTTANTLVVFLRKITHAVRLMSSRSYWTRVNTVEAWGFATKIAIIFPGLLFNKQWWWLYIFAIASSISLIWTSTRKTLPTIILFNVAWVCLASSAIIKHFV